MEIKSINQKKKEIGRAIVSERVKRPAIRDFWISKRTGLQSSQLRAIENGVGLYSFEALLRYMSCLEMDIFAFVNDKKELKIEQEEKQEWLISKGY